LLFQTQGVVATAIKALWRQALEVTNTRQCDGAELIQEVVSAVTAEGDVATNLHSFSDFKVRDRSSGAGADRSLTSDRGHVSESAFQFLFVGSRTHVHDNLDKLRNLHYRAELEFLHQLRNDGVLINLTESWSWQGRD